MKKNLYGAAALLSLILITGCVTADNNREEKNMEPIELNRKECYKEKGFHNPLMTQKFGADPWVLVYKDTVYVYMTADIIEKKSNGEIKDNSYSKIHQINILSSKDLVNWTDCGCIDLKASGVNWAHNSWAPAAAWKTIDGKDKFFVYFADSANGIGVLSSDSPTGPFTDPIGHALISRNTPNCNNVTWLFDPAVLVDDDGTGYIYFGGGVPGNTEEQISKPGTARAVQLGEDMTSIVGKPVALDVPFLFEDSGINKFNGKYYYSYCTNWSVPEGQKVKSGQIAYMTSDNPLGPFEFQGVVLKNPGEFFGDWGNNHHCIFTFKGQNYIAYHARILEKKMFISNGYRSTNIDFVELQDDGKFASVKCTKKGVPQVVKLNPYEETNAATISTMAGIQTEGCNTKSKYYGSGEMCVTKTKRGDWIFAEGADFGTDSEGAKSITASVKIPEGTTSSILVYIDSAESEPAAEINLGKCKAGEEYQDVTVKLNNEVTGVHNIIFVFSGDGFEWKSWKFNR